MPFDGIGFQAPAVVDTGIFPLWSSAWLPFVVPSAAAAAGAGQARARILVSAGRRARRCRGSAAPRCQGDDRRSRRLDPAHLPVVPRPALRGRRLARGSEPARRSGPRLVGPRSIDPHRAGARLYQCRGDERPIVARRRAAGFRRGDRSRRRLSATINSGAAMSLAAPANDRAIG